MTARFSTATPDPRGRIQSEHGASSDVRQRIRWLTPTASVAATLAVTLVLVCGTAYLAMRGAPSALRFFDPRRSPTFDETCVVSAMDYALSSTEANDVIFIGDSACRTGVDPVRFERATGLGAYNLGIVGDLGPGVMLNVAKGYLSTHSTPRLVVLCLSPVGLERDVPWYWTKLRNHFVDCYGFDVRSPRSLEGNLGYTFRQGTLLAWNAASASLTGKSDDVRDCALIGMEKVTYRQFERVARQKRGHFELPGRGPTKNLDRPGNIVEIHDVWDSGVRRLVEACDNAGVPLLIRFCPVSAEATRNLKFERVEAWLKNLQASSPRLLSGDHDKILRYPPELCWDYSHPNPLGAQKFTQLVADDVRFALDFARQAKGK
jgi:hypothetical protein